MSYTLLIVESPAKCGKIEKFLGPGYKCIASYGHLQQLENLKSIDLQSFEPRFTPLDNKRQQIERLRQLINSSNDVLIATDDDREGEGIAWHICSLFNLPISTTKRIIFHEITEKAIKNAVKNPTLLNMNIVFAQQGRQILDLLVGFKISPMLWQNISRTKKGLSAGRCQTPALRLVYDNQKDIDNSPGKKVYNTTGYFTEQNLQYTLNHHFDDEDKVVEFLEESTEHNHVYTCSKPKNTIKKPPTPFTTSSLQQSASNELHISPKDTMMICQKLYEGGYITYMRTDSKIYSKEFIEKIKPYISEKYGEKYINENIDMLSEKESEKKTIKKKTKKSEKEENNNAQEAHEAIRPTNITCSKLPDEMESKEIRMYNLIWKNTMESCMAEATYSSISSKITAPFSHEYKYNSEQVIFPGWKIISGYDEENKYYTYLLSIKQDLIVKYKKIINKVTMKDLKMHYTEAKLVQLLEQKGIGRPSTYSALIDKIQERGYVKKDNIKGKSLVCTDFELENDEITEIENKREFGNENNKLIIQDVGILVLDFLLKTFDSFFEYEYTKQMEDELDLIAKGEKNYKELCKSCLDEIDKYVSENPHETKMEVYIDDNHTYMIGKNGPVIKYMVGDNITFKSVKKDIDIDKLKSGEYKIDDIIETDNRDMGKYKGDNLYIKKGKFGLYVECGKIKKSLNSINKSIDTIELDDIIKVIETTSTNNCVREIDKTLSVRNGKFGDYIFYKTEKMSKPIFYKLNGFMDDYKTCDIKILKDWIIKTYFNKK